MQMTDLQENSSQEVSPKRIRRTKADIETSILQATKELIEKKGFKDLTISAIANHAKIETVVFYNRYTDLDDLLDKFVRSYDYWMNDAIKFDPVNLDVKQNNENLLLGLIDSINSNKVMQQLLAWELIDNNEITQRTADNRERYSKKIINYFSERFEDSEIDICAISALLISGIYYLAMHKHISTFCFIDFNTKEGIDLLKKSVKGLLDKMYSRQPIDNAYSCDIYSIVKNMIDKGYDFQTIKEITNLTDDKLNNLLKHPNLNESLKESNITVPKKRGRPKKISSK